MPSSRRRRPGSSPGDVPPDTGPGDLAAGAPTRRRITVGTAVAVVVLVLVLANLLGNRWAPSFCA
ncbi:hypothetical protein ACFQZM_31520, partial [Actinomadura fibrosa]